MKAARRFGLFDLVLYATAMTLSLRWLATAAAAGPASLPIWGLAAVLFLGPLAIASSEMTSRHAGEGAVYAWTRATFGPFAGFLCGWLYWTCNLPFFSGLFLFTANILAAAMGAEAAARVHDPVVFLTASIALALLIAGMHAAGLGVGKWLPMFGAGASVLLLAGLVIAGAMLALAGRSATDFAGASYLPPLDANGAALWATMVFAFGGAEGVATLRNETIGGMRTIMRALGLVAATLALAYVAGSAAMLAILPAEEATRLGGIPDAIVAGLEKLGLGALAPAALVLLALSMLGSLSAWFGVAARIPYAVGLDHGLPRGLARRHEKTGAPVAAIGLQAAIVIALLALSQAGETLESAYDFLVSMSVLSYTLPFLFLFAAYWRAQAAPVEEGVWVAPGGPARRRAIAAIGFLTALSAIICSLAPSPDAPDKAAAVLKLVGASAVLIGVGAVAYIASKRRAPIAATGAAT